MSKVAIEGNASGTGTLTIAAPNTNSNFTLSIPAETGSLLTSVSTVAASQITSALNATGSAPIYACRAWVNFNGTGTVAILASGNVSSITDNGTGEYTVNFTTAMPDANYQVSCAGFMQANNARRLGVQGVRGTFLNPSNGYATGSVQIGCAIGDSGNGNAEMADTDRVGVAIFR